MKKQKPLLTKADINWLIDSMKLVFPTKEESTRKFDRVMEKLDTFVGELRTKRTEQTLHDGDHERIDQRLTRLEKRAGLSPVAD